MQPPLCWKKASGAVSLSLAARSVVRTISPTAYTPGQPDSISLAVTPDSGVFSWAVEETPPTSWTVASINENGAWDDVNKKVKWGPSSTPTAGR